MFLRFPRALCTIILFWRISRSLMLIENIFSPRGIRLINIPIAKFENFLKMYPKWGLSEICFIIRIFKCIIFAIIIYYYILDRVTVVRNEWILIKHIIFYIFIQLLLKNTKHSEVNTLFILDMSVHLTINPIECNNSFLTFLFSLSIWYDNKCAEHEC